MVHTHAHTHFTTKTNSRVCPLVVTDTTVYPTEIQHTGAITLPTVTQLCVSLCYSTALLIKYWIYDDFMRLN